jgi:hypothetical protein
MMHISRSVVINVLKDCTAGLLGWEEYDPSQFHKLLTQWHSIQSQNIWNFGNTTARVLKACKIILLD